MNFGTGRNDAAAVGRVELFGLRDKEVMEPKLPLWSSPSLRVRKSPFSLQQQQLLKDGLLDSAFMFGNLDNPQFPLLIGFGDALVTKSQYKRATTFYNRAILQIKGNSSQHDRDLVTTRFKLAKCYAKLGNADLAVAEIKAIPAASRTVSMHVELGKLYRCAGMKRNAISCFKEALKLNALCIESLVHMIELNVNTQQLLSFYQKLAGTTAETVEFVKDFIHAHSCLSKLKFSAAVTAYGKLVQRHPNNTYLLQHYAYAYYSEGSTSEACNYFRKAQRLDPFCLDFMDVFASVIKSMGNELELNRLAHQLLSIDKSRPEPWNTVAMYTDMKGQKARALQFVEKAVSLDDQHVVSFIIKGNILLSMGKYEVAIQSYKRAHSLRHHMSIFQGPEFVSSSVAVTTF